MKGKSKSKKDCLEVQVCPQCLGSKVFRINSLAGDMTGALALLPPKYACSECGWIGRLVIMRNLEASENTITSNDEGKNHKVGSNSGKISD